MSFCKLFSRIFIFSRSLSLSRSPCVHARSRGLHSVSYTGLDRALKTDLASTQGNYEPLHLANAVYLYSHYGCVRFSRNAESYYSQRMVITARNSASVPFSSQQMALWSGAALPDVEPSSSFRETLGISQNYSPSAILTCDCIVCYFLFLRFLP